MWTSVRTAWAGKRVLIVGLARSGLAAAELLLTVGASPLLYDEKPLDMLSAKEHIMRLVELGCKESIGADPFALLSLVDALVISPAVPLDAPLIRKAMDISLPVIGELELGALFAKGPIYAVTGTNGKTTTVSLLGEMFRLAGRRAFVCGNIGFPITSAVLESNDGDPLVVEVSSFQMETAETFRPYVAAITNISPDHLDRHGTMKKYISLKKEVFARQSQQEYAILNADDKEVCVMASDLRAKKLWFSARDQVDCGVFVRAGEIILRTEDKELIVCETQSIRLAGKHNLENVLAAVAMAFVAKIPLDAVRLAIGQFGGVEHRIEKVRTIKGITFINDSKGTNPESAIKAVESMTRPTVLLAGGYDKKVSFRELAEAIVKNILISHVIVYGQTKGQIEQALKDLGYENISRATDMFDAVDLARSVHVFDEGNILLSPACASFDQFDDYEQRGVQFKRYVMSLNGESHE